MRHYLHCSTLFLAFVCFGCTSRPGLGTNRPDERLAVPANARLVAFGKSDSLILPPHPEGTFYFTDSLGNVVWVFTAPADKSAQSLGKKDASVNSVLRPDESYRVYFSAAPDLPSDRQASASAQQ